MAAYEYFAATDTNTFIEHIKTKAEAYGWVIDYYASGRLHLHNADGAHFELFYASSSAMSIRGCTGWDSEAGSTAQPGVSSNCQITSNQRHFIVICPHSIYLKIFSSTDKAQNVQFGSIMDKVGVWTGGICISGTMAYVGAYAFALWPTYNLFPSQVYINGNWSPLTSVNGGGVYGVCDREVYEKMPFAYSGGILPVPILLVRIDPLTTSYRNPLGYAPDVRFAAGGTVYAQLEEITIDGDVWVAINQEDVNGSFASAPHLLIRLAEAV